MNCLRSLPISFAFAAVLFTADPAEAGVRKCQATPNGLPVDNSMAIAVLNGEILGPLASEGSDRRPGYVVLSEVGIPPEDILRIDIVCLEVVEEDHRVGRAAVAIVTKSGAAGFMESHLRGLAALQEEHRSSTGSYAESLAELDFFTSRAPLPIHLAAHPDAWEARVQLEGLGLSCWIRGGEGNQADQALNVVHCAAT